MTKPLDPYDPYYDDKDPEMRLNDTVCVPQGWLTRLIKDLSEANERADEAEGKLFQLEDDINDVRASRGLKARDDIELELEERIDADLITAIGLKLNDIRNMTPDEARLFKAQPRRAAERDVILSALMPNNVKNQFTGSLAVAVLPDNRIAVFDPDAKEPGLTVLAGDDSKLVSYLMTASGLLRRLDAMVTAGSGNVQHEFGCPRFGAASWNDTVVCACVRSETSRLIEELELIFNKDPMA